MALNKSDFLAYFENDLGIDISDIEDDTPLFSSGIIDSFSLISLITFIEERCGFSVSPIDVNLDNMDSLSHLLSFVERNTGDGKGI